MLHADSLSLHHEPKPSQEYIDRLLGAYPDLDLGVVRELTDEPRLAPLLEQPGQFIPYKRFNENIGSGNTLMFLPGFGESILAKLPFAFEMANQGYDVILPGQNRKGLMHDDNKAPLATDSQARNYEAVLANEGLLESPVDFAAHSYGALIFDGLVARIVSRRPDYFKHSTAFLLSPAGVAPEHSEINRGVRWLAMMKSETHRDGQVFPDIGNEVKLASLRNLARNPARSKAEDSDMLKKRLDFPVLCKYVGNVVIVPYLNDSMFPVEFLEPFIMEAIQAGATAIYPVPWLIMRDKSVLTDHDATHNDEGLNPSRVAGAIDQYLRQAAKG